MTKELNELGQRLNFLQQQLSQLTHQLEELQNVLVGIESVCGADVGEEILVPLGAGVFAKANLQDSSKILMNVGSQVVVEKTVKGAAELVAEQVEELKKIKEKMDRELASLSSQMQLMQLRG
jgi:prefoldin alpha subunit